MQLGRHISSKTSKQCKEPHAGTTIRVQESSGVSEPHGLGGQGQLPGRHGPLNMDGIGEQRGSPAAESSRPLGLVLETGVYKVGQLSS